MHPECIAIVVKTKEIKKEITVLAVSMMKWKFPQWKLNVTKIEQPDVMQTPVSVMNNIEKTDIKECEHLAVVICFSESEQKKPTTTICITFEYSQQERLWILQSKCELVSTNTQGVLYGVQTVGTADDVRYTCRNECMQLIVWTYVLPYTFRQDPVCMCEQTLIYCMC